MIYTNSELKEKFIEMATEASRYANKNYGDLGKILMVLETKPCHKALINNDSKVDRPQSEMYVDFVDKFNQYIWPKYPYLEDITFVYFGNIRTMNIMTAFMTQTLADLRDYTNQKSKELSNKTINTSDLSVAYNDIQKLYMGLVSELSIKLDELILKYIKNYNPSINTISQFKSKYGYNYNYMHKMIDKVIENM